MARKKKETLVHLDLETLSKETSKKTPQVDVEEDNSLGGILRRTREKKKLKVAQIAKKLCIRDVYLEALENGHYYVFPGLAYGIGFLRTYARFLDLDAEEMVEKFHAETSSIQEEPLEMPIPKNANLMPSGRTIFKGLAALIIVYLLWYIGTSLTRDEVVPETETSAVATVEETQTDSIQDETVTEQLKTEEEAVLSDATVKDIVPLAEDKQTQSVEKIQSVQAPIIADTVTKPAQPVQMKKSGFGSKLWSKLTPAKVYGNKKAGALSFVATEEVWVKVSDGTQTVLEEIFYKGDRYNVPADTNYTLTTANAGALTVYVNGKKAKILGAKGVLADDVVLKPEHFN